MVAEKRCVLALDQGTTSSRAILFDAAGLPLAMAQETFPQHTRPLADGASAESARARGARASPAGPPGTGDHIVRPRREQTVCKGLRSR